MARHVGSLEHLEIGVQTSLEETLHLVAASRRGDEMVQVEPQTCSRGPLYLPILVQQGRARSSARLGEDFAQRLMFGAEPLL